MHFVVFPFSPHIFEITAHANFVSVGLLTVMNRVKSQILPESLIVILYLLPTATTFNSSVIRQSSADYSAAETARCCRVYAVYHSS